MTAEPRDELHRLVDEIVMAPGWREALRAAVAAADRENAELRGLLSRVASPAVRYDQRVYHLTDDFAALTPFLSEDDIAAAGERPSETDARVKRERDDLRAQLAAAQAQLAEVLNVAYVEHQGAATAEARLEAVRALVDEAFGTRQCHVRDECEMHTMVPAAKLRAALSAAPQPEPERVEPDSPLGRLFDYLTQPEPPASAEPARCGCARCDNARRAGESFPESLCRFMIVCATCGNKRCPRAAWHGNECTGSNEPGQPGSNYPAVRWADMFGIAPDFDGPTEADR